jgi:hypothetical protein
MDELAFRRTVHQIAVPLTEWQLAALFLLTNAIDILLLCQHQQEIQFCTSMLPQ